MFLLVDCVDYKFENPQVPADPNISANKTIKELKALFTGDTLRIKEDIVIEATVISSDEEGNFYKELYVQDNTAGIAIMLDASYLFNTFKVGQRVLIRCKDLYLGKDASGTIKLGSIYIDRGIKKFGRIAGQSYINAHVIPLNKFVEVVPKTIKLNQLHDSLIHTLILIDSVQFSDLSINQTMADKINKLSRSLYLINKKGQQLIVYNSGYASFASDSVPKGFGYIVGVFSKYGANYQLLIRSMKDICFNLPRKNFFTPILKNFDDGDIYSGGWTVKTIKGVSWVLGSYSSYKYVECNNYNGGNRLETESWYISPKFDLSETSAPYLEFRNACKYSGDLLKVYYSTDYDGQADPNSATWVALNPNLDLNTSSYSWTNSGKLYLPKTAKYIAFKYTGSTTSGRHWEVDDIKIYDDGK